jgi:hypothetical protein
MHNKSMQIYLGGTCTHVNNDVVDEREIASLVSQYGPTPGSVIFRLLLVGRVFSPS